MQQHPQAMPRAALYARFSTELQNASSSEDQIELCRVHAQHKGFKVVAEFRDDAVSGASIHNRPGLQQLVTAAMSGAYDVVLVEAFDRLSRRMADLADLHDRLAFKGVRLIGVHDGEATTMNVGMRGIVAQMFREDNVHKVRRGMSALITKGLSAGGKAYGYRPDPANPGQPVIVPEEAAVVRRIFEDYSSGNSPKAICRRLNGEGVTPPRGKLWAPSALIGSAPRGTGLLRNALYSGKIVWNKVRMIKDPDTGKRVSRPNPTSDWQSTEAPDLAIIPAALFESVQAQLAERSIAGTDKHMSSRKRPKRLLSGLLRYGACGAGMSVAGKDKSGRTRLRCSAHTNSGACSDPKTFYLDEVEELLIDSLVRELASPDQIHAYAEAYIKKLRSEASREVGRREQIKARLASIDAENARLMKWALEGIGDEYEHLAKQNANGQERDRLKIELERLPQGSNIVVHPSSIKAFAERLQASRPKLHMTIYHLDTMGELSRLVR